MIIYRDNISRVKARGFLSEIVQSINNATGRHTIQHSDAVDLLINFSDFETALVDNLTIDTEITDNLTKALRNTGKILGKVLLDSWDKNNFDRENFQKLENYIRVISGSSLPENITVKVPEGYAYYGYFPESYIEAAEKFYSKAVPDKAVVIGIRSIGTSFSSAVGAVLEKKGCDVTTFTLRPKGEYENRYIRFSDELSSELLSKRNVYFLIVDEGPGLSGTSFGVTAERLSSLGIPDEKIIFISSWEPDGSGLISELGRSRWKAHLKFSSNFDDTWIKSGRLSEFFPYKELSNISNGLWRSLFYKNPSEFPVTYPAEERKKYICSKKPLNTGDKGSGTYEALPGHESGELYLAEFIGLGRYGKRLYERAKILSEAGYIPRVHGIENGFLISEFVKGMPLKKDEITFGQLNSIAAYMDFLQKKFPSEPSRNFDEVFEMIAENVCEYMGGDWIKVLEKQKRKFGRLYSRSAIAVDGHMFPHDWITAQCGFYKTDGIVHHADQFFPGCQSIIWDIAGFSTEAELGSEKEEFLINRFCEISGQKEIYEHLDFYKLAYLAFRMGYTSMASNVMTNKLQDGRNSGFQAMYYASKLKELIAE